MSSSFSAYKILSGHDDTVLAIVWWDGERIRSNNSSFLGILKREHISIYQYGDGKKFFDVIPSRYSNGYVRCKLTKVDASGKEV